MTYQGWQSINAPVSINLSRCPAYMKASLFVRDTPARCGKSSNGWRHQLHGNFTPGRFSVGCSHCLRRLHAGKRYHARTVTEQEYHCPYCRSWPYREPPGISWPLVLAPCRTADRGRIDDVASRCLVRHILARRQKWLTAIGMCLMNGYEVVKGQTHSPHKRGTGEGLSIAFHLMHLKEGGVGVENKKISKYFFRG